MSETIRMVAQWAIAILGGVTIGWLLFAAIIDLTTFQQVQRVRARAEAGRDRRRR